MRRLTRDGMAEPVSRDQMLRRERGMSVEIAYTEQRENAGPMILHGVSYSAYTRRYGSYLTYEIATSSQSSNLFIFIFSGRLWTSAVFPLQ